MFEAILWTQKWYNRFETTIFEISRIRWGKNPQRIQKWKNTARSSGRYCTLWWCAWWSLINCHELTQWNFRIVHQTSSMQKVFVSGSLSKINDAHFMNCYVHELDLYQIGLVHPTQGTDYMICKGFVVERICCFHSALQTLPKHMVSNVAPKIGLLLLNWYRYLIDEHLSRTVSYSVYLFSDSLLLFSLYDPKVYQLCISESYQPDLRCEKSSLRLWMVVVWLWKCYPCH